MKIFTESEAPKVAFCVNITCLSATRSLYICPFIEYLHSNAVERKHSYTGILQISCMSFQQVLDGRI